MTATRPLFSRVSALALAVAAFTVACRTPGYRAEAPATAPPATLALVGVHLVDVEGGVVKRDQTILVAGNRVVAVHDRAMTPPTATQVIDATGLFVIPGLWDMHVHVMYRQGYDVFGPLFIAKGITGIRDMGNSPMPQAAVQQLRRSVDSGDIVGPRFVAPGPLLDGPRAGWPFALKIGTTERAAFVVDSLVGEGASFLKVYSGLSSEVFDAIARRARHHGVPFVGHVPDAVPIRSALETGMRSMEHLLGVQEGCAANEAELDAERQRLLHGARSGAQALDYEAVSRHLWSLAKRDSTRCEALFIEMAKHEIWQVPTLALRRVNAYPLDSSALLDPRLRFVAPPIRQWWSLSPRDTSADAWTERRRRYEEETSLVRQMQRAGVRLLAGSDAPNRFLYPAFSLHEELAAMVDAGLSEAVALQAATVEPARYLGALDSLGSIRPGYVADLVLLHGNPLEDIRQTSNIAAVVADGRYFHRAALDELIAAAAARAGR